MSNTPKIRFKGFTDDWEQRKLGELCERVTRKNKNRESDLPLTIASQYGLIDQRDFFNKVVAAKDANGNDVAFLYKWDGSGEEGDDLYFNVSVNGQTYNFTVESYLCDKDSEVYKAVKELKIGDTIDMEGFLYWYEGANPHITEVTVK